MCPEGHNQQSKKVNLQKGRNICKSYISKGVSFYNV